MNYFPQVACAYSTNPFCVDVVNLPVGSGEQEELGDIQDDETAKTEHKLCNLFNLWLSMTSSYHTFAKQAIPHLLIFSYHVGIRARILNAVKCKIKKPNLSHCS